MYARSDNKEFFEFFIFPLGLEGAPLLALVELVAGRS